jgi:choline dehydrogenase-like flavoprotein
MRSDGKGEVQRLTGKRFILALNALETPRLLLESASASHPNGLGNSSGLLGRYLMFHVIFQAVGVFADEVRSYRGRVSTHGMADFTVDDGSPGRCVDCHDVHGSENLFLMRPVVGGERIELTTPELVKGDGTGTCEVCHTNTAHYRRDRNGTAHTGEWCITCHTHGAGFLP